MLEESLKVTNKYGKDIVLPPTTNTKPALQIEEVLQEAGVEYEKEYCFDVKGLRNTKYDFAVLKEGKPVLFIEYDGPAHYNPSFYRSTGVRPERAQAHVVKACLNAAKKDILAQQYGVHVLRITEPHMTAIRDLILSYLFLFVDGDTEKTNEIQMIKMLDKYGWDFPYVVPSAPSKTEAKYLQETGLM